MNSPSLSPGRSPQASKSSFTKSISSDVNAQSFSSILNNPNSSSSLLGSWFSSSSSAPVPEFAPLPTKPKPGSELTRPEFQTYLSSVSEPHARFLDILRQHERDDQSEQALSTPGAALVACLREVPALYFKEDFELEDGATFKSACPFRTVAENIALQEKLSQYLDVVELHLVREISLRSSSFFEAQVQLEDLTEKIVEGCGRVRELKEMIRVLDSDLVGSARKVQELSAKRGDLVGLQNKLRLVLSVNQALSTLQLLVASADCLGALDIIDDLQHLLEGDELIGLHCLRHLRDHVSTSVDSINSVLSAEFIRASVRGPEDIDSSLAVSASNGRYDEVGLEEERTSNFQDQLLPLVIGLLRTGKFPAVLRVYRDTLASDIKTSVKMTVLNMQLESDSLSGEGMADADGGGSSLGSKLKSLSPDSFLKLLEEIFRIVQTRLIRASEVKKAVEWIMGNLNGHYAAASVAAALAHGAVAPDLSQDAVDRSRSSLSSQNATKASFMQGSGHDAASPNISRNFRADILRENAEALFAACDAAHGRWAKIVGIRSQIHLKLRLQDFLSVYNISQEFITSTEKIGGRLGYSIRGTLQSQAKSFIEFQHESRIAKMRALLDQENWVEIDVPDEFQSIVNSLSSPDSNTYGESDAVPDDIDTKSNDTESISNGSSRVDAGQKELSQHVEQPDSNGMSSDHMGKNDSSRSTIETEHNSDVNASQGSSSSTKERGKSALRVLYFRGVGYHMVNCGLYLVKMISEYIDMNNSLPTLSAEVVHRIAEILKLFNSRTAHLVLGANALQVSGLRSITARHLAMASQVISCTYAIIPEIRRILLLKVPDSYKGLLQSEIHRVETDYKNHRDEIHLKLVQIMRERLLVHLRSLPQIVEGWNRSEATDIQPSQFARSLTKEVGYLLRTLSKLLLEEDVQSIFGQVVMILHSQISEAFSQFEISTPQAKSRLRCDLQHILGCIRSLPSDNSSKSDSQNWGPLDEFFAKSFDSESSE